MKEFTLTVNGEEYDVSANTLEEAKGYLMKSLQGDKQLSALEQSRALGTRSPTATQVPAPQKDFFQQVYEAPGKALDYTKKNFLPASPMDALSEVPQNLGMMARGATEGALAIPGLVTNLITGTANAVTGSKLPSYDKVIAAGFKALGVPDAEAQNELQKIMETVSGGVSGAKALTDVTQYVAPKLGQSIAGTLAANPTAQQVQGGVAPLGGMAAGATAESLGASPEVQSGAEFLGTLGTGATVGSLGPGGMRLGGESGKIVSDAKDAGVKVMTSDIFKPKGQATTAQRLIEGNPFFGTGKLREGQQAQREQLVQNIVKEYGADDAGRIADEVAADALKTRGDEIGKNLTAKMEVLTRLDDIGGNVKATKAIKAIDDEIARLKSLNVSEANSVITDLQNWRSGLLGADGTGQRLLNIEELRGLVGNSYSGGSLTDAAKKIGKTSANPIYRALKEDMTDYIRANGVAQDYTKWSVANKKLSTMMDDLEMSAFNKLLSKGDIEPEAVTNLLYSKTPSRAEMLFNGLSDKGRAMARQSIIAKAYEGSKNSPDKPGQFMAELEKLKVPVSTFFKGEELAKLKGYEKVIDATNRASAAMANPPTGQTNLVPQMTAAVVGAPAVAAGLGGLPILAGAGGAAALGGVGIASRIYESPAVRDILIKLSRVKSGSQEEIDLIKKYTATASAIAASQQNKEQK